MPTFKEFRERHESTGYFDDWKLDDSVEMRDAWQSLPFREMRNLATFEGVLTDNELRRLSVFAARQVQHKLQDDASRKAIDVAEQFAEGQATLEELAAAHNASKSEPWFRGGNANAISSAHAASDPKSGLVWSASEAISAASSALNGKDNRLAFQARIVEWLRKNTKPNFDNPPTLLVSPVYVLRNKTTGIIVDPRTAADFFVNPAGLGCETWDDVFSKTRDTNNVVEGYAMVLKDLPSVESVLPKTAERRYVYDTAKNEATIEIETRSGRAQVTAHLFVECDAHDCWINAIASETDGELTEEEIDYALRAIETNDLGV